MSVFFNQLTKITSKFFLCLNFFRLSGCNISERSCEAVSSFLSSQLSSLREIDLSNNSLQDSGMKILCAESQYWKLETFRSYQVIVSYSPADINNELS